MTHPTADDTVVIRQPLLLRAVFTAAVVAGIVFVLGPGLQRALRDGETTTLLFLVPFSIVWAGFFVRTILLSVVASADGRLTVRNRFATRTYDRSEVEDVRLAAGGLQGALSGQGAVQMLLTDGSIQSLDATLPMPGGRATVEEHHRRLRAWLGR